MCMWKNSAWLRDNWGQWNAGGNRGAVLRELVAEIVKVYRERLW